MQHTQYLQIGGGYSYAPLRVGLSLMNPQGKEVYFQPGEQEATIRDTIEALEECAPDKLDAIADMALSEYFA